MQDRPKILTMVNFYFPGYKAGGSLRTISNMVDHLSDDFEFWLITRDRDLGDEQPYTSVNINEWNRVGKAMVFYASPYQLTFSGLKDLINKTQHDILYLNGFFDPKLTLIPLLLQFRGKLPDKPIVLAPRGEFSQGALALKRLKKTIYIKVVRLFGLYDNLIWQASSEHESEDIRREFNVKQQDIHIALDLPTKTFIKDIQNKNSQKNLNTLHVIFLSRISPMKNLDYALRILGKVKKSIIFDIYGPIEDKAYWEKCQALLELLPNNIKINYCGSVLSEQVPFVFAQYDLFFLPTRGENYGHVIAESLSVGTPVLISDQTPWRNLQKDGLGWDIGLEDINEFVRILELYALKTLDEKRDMRKHICQKVLERLTSTEVLDANRQLFYKCIQKQKRKQ